MVAAQSSPVSGFVFVVAVLATNIVLVAALADSTESREEDSLTNQFLLAFLGTASGIVAALLLGALHRSGPGRPLHRAKASEGRHVRWGRGGPRRRVS
jgi:hypothetical protein